MSTVSILIECPKELQIEIEELCINKGVDFTKYFLGLHHDSKVKPKVEQFTLPGMPKDLPQEEIPVQKEEEAPKNKGKKR